MNIVFVGCGFVADFYFNTLPNYPELKLLGVTDRNKKRLDEFSSYYNVPVYDTLDKVLDDDRVDAIINLTNPVSHYEVTKKSLIAGKHVYSEKPLSMDYSQAKELVEIANKKQLCLSGAPCSVLGEAAQTMWNAIRQNSIGKIRVVYAELDDGLIHKMRYRKWMSASGAPWPAKDEFETGCTFEHAGYYVTWLLAFWGPAKKVTSFSSCLIENKETDEPIDKMAPDFSVACIEFESGVVARLTCSIIAPHNHGLLVVGDDGIFKLNECWNYGDTVLMKKRTLLGSRLEKYHLLEKALGLGFKKIPLLKNPKLTYKSGSNNNMDFSRGIAEMAAAISEKRQPRLSSDFILHVNEVVCAIQNTETMGTPYKLQSTFRPMQPMPWAN